VLKLVSRRAAVVLAGGSLILAAGLLPAQAATTGWRADATFAIRGDVSIFTSVGASSPSDAWATGFSAKPTGTSSPQGVIRHWTGKTWRLVTLPAKIARGWARQAPLFTRVGVSSARNVWVFGGFTGGYLRLDGSRWSLGQLPGASKKSGALVVIDAVKVFSGTDVWAFGQRLLVSGTQDVATPYAAHYDGRKWSTATVPGLPSGGGEITAVAAVSSGDMWAVESAVPSSLGLSAPAAANPAVARSAVAASPAARLAGARLRAAASAAAPPVVLQWTASSGWQDAATQPSLAATDQLVSGVAEPNGDVWFGGSARNSAQGTSPLTAEWNGSIWSVKHLPGKASSAAWQLGAMAPDGTGGIWALAEDSISGSEHIWHLHGAGWSQVKPAFGKHKWALLALALVPRTHSVWAVGAVEAGKSGANGFIAVDGPLPR
jgi:hypothetical protein